MWLDKLKNTNLRHQTQRAFVIFLLLPFFVSLGYVAANRGGSSQ